MPIDIVIANPIRYPGVFSSLGGANRILFFLFLLNV